jgi:TPR repeat protein
MAGPAEHELNLVFGDKWSMVPNMATRWLRRWFSRTSKPGLRETQAKAEAGDADAQFGLGLKFGNSAGASLDFARAAQWYRKAADQDHALAQFNLGIMYAKGQGVPVDDAEAIRWIQRAAELGDAGAQFNLGMRCHRISVGRGPNTIESRIEAYKWYQLAAAQGYLDSETACEGMSLAMTHDEIAEGKHRAAQFTVSHPQTEAV